MVKVSVVIPAYNQAEYLPSAIQSVLDQSLSDWELLIVDDGSKDATAEVVSDYQDTRIHYIYQENKGLPGARNTGIRQASGEYLAFLDADDYYHREKLLRQAQHLDKNADIGLSYASRISVDQSGAPLRLRRAPDAISLALFIEGFPFTINDLLVRRTWLDQIGNFDESFILHSEDRDFYLRLILAGCQFGRVDQALSYRRVHIDRAFGYLQARLDTMFRALETVFSDPRCPVGILGMRDLAYARDYLVWGYQASIQGEDELAQSYYSQAIRLSPNLSLENYRAITRFLILSATADGTEHSEKTERAAAQLPLDKTWIEEQTPRMVAMGYLMRAARDALWDRQVIALQHFARAAQLNCQVNDDFLRYWTEQLMNHEAEFGADIAQQALDRISMGLHKAGFENAVRELRANIYINQAFARYHAGKLDKIPQKVIKAVINNPNHLKNRGVLSMFLRSLLKTAPSEIEG